MNDNDYLYGIDPVTLARMSEKDKRDLIAMRKQNAAAIGGMNPERFDDEDMEPSEQEIYNKMQSDLAAERARKEALREGYLIPGEKTPKGSYQGVWSKIKNKLTR